MPTPPPRSRRPAIAALGLVTISLWAAWGPAAAAAAVPEEIRFEILRDGEPIGSHAITFTPGPQAGQTTATIAIRMEVRLLGLVAYRYVHDNRVVVDADGRLVAMDARTDDDGDQVTVTVARSDDGLSVTASGEAAAPAATAPADTLATVYFDPSTVTQTQLINSQSGGLVEAHFQRVGEDRVEVAGTPRTAVHWRDTGALGGADGLDLWYDQATGDWVGLRFVARDSEIRYRRLSPVAP